MAGEVRFKKEVSRQKDYFNIMISWGTVKFQTEDPPHTGLQENIK